MDVKRYNKKLEHKKRQQKWL